MMTMSAWIPLMDYAIKKGVSISTLRRYIKSNKIKYRTEAGKYLLWDDEAGVSFLTESSGLIPPRSVSGLHSGLQSEPHSEPHTESHTEYRYALPTPGAYSAARASTDAPPATPDRIQHLERQLQKAQEEIAELKMLVSLYEEKLTPKHRAL